MHDNHAVPSPPDTESETPSAIEYVDPALRPVGLVQGDLTDEADLELGAPDGRSIFRNRNFMLIWSAQAISQTAQQTVWFALLVVVEQTTGSATQQSFAVISAILPAVLFSLLAGIFVDRMEKRGVMLLTTAARAVVMLGYLFYPVALPFVYLVNFVSNTLTQFFQPAESAMLPQLVRKKQLLTANSLYNITFNGSQAAGLVILGPILSKIFGAWIIFIAAAILTGVAAVAVWFLPHSKPPEKSLRDLKRENVGQELTDDFKAAWRFITMDVHTLLAMLHLTLCAMLTLLVATVAPFFATNVLHIRADDAVFVLAPAGVGLAGGAALLHIFTRRWTREHLVLFGLWTMSIGFVLLGFVSAFMGWLLPMIAPERFAANSFLSTELFPPVMAIALVIGLAIALVMIPAQTVIMERAPRDSLGRIIAAQIALGNLVPIVPLLLIGQLTDRFGVNQVIVGVGIFILLITLFTHWYPRSSRAIRSAQQIEAEAS